MSRIGRMPIALPAGVTVNVAEGNVVTVTGKLGTLTETFNSRMNIAVEGNEVIVTRPTDEKEDRSIHGPPRALLANMVEGVSNGFSKKLEIVGVGYRVSKVGKQLKLELGHSHPIFFDETDMVTFDVPDSNTIIVKCIDKQMCGQIAAEIRSKRPPEPYHGKGVKYEGERIRRKAGKAGK